MLSFGELLLIKFSQNMEHSSLPPLPAERGKKYLEVYCNLTKKKKEIFETLIQCPYLGIILYEIPFFIYEEKDGLFPSFSFREEEYISSSYKCNSLINFKLITLLYSSIYYPEINNFLIHSRKNIETKLTEKLKWLYHLGKPIKQDEIFKYLIFAIHELNWNLLKFLIEDPLFKSFHQKMNHHWLLSYAIEEEKLEILKYFWDKFPPTEEKFYWNNVYRVDILTPEFESFLRSKKFQIIESRGENPSFFRICPANYFPL